MTRKSLVPIVLPADPTAALEAATKQYVDGLASQTTLDTRYVNVDGDSMTGALIISGNLQATTMNMIDAPTSIGHVTRKDYVDAQRDTRVAKVGDTMTGDLRINSDSGRVAFYLANGTTFVGNFGVNAGNLFVNTATNAIQLQFMTSGVTRFTVANALVTSTVPVVLPADPASALHAATKQYVDGLAAQATLDSRYVNVTGDTITGSVYLQPALRATTALRVVIGQVTAGSETDFDLSTAGTVSVPTPSSNAHAATKLYVDGLTALFTSTVKGTVPPPTTVTGKFLKDDGTWAAAGGSTDVMWVGTSVPSDGAIEIWYDTDEPDPDTIQRQAIQVFGTSNYSPIAAHENNLVMLPSAVGQTVTVLLNSTVALPVGYRVDIAQGDVGQITIAAQGGVTIVATPGLKLRAKGSVASLIKTAAPDTWLATGDLTL
jgi:hypothetical protein